MAMLELVKEACFEALWPTRCVGCDAPGELLCEGCRTGLSWIEQRHACPVCGAPYGWLVCTECDGAWPTEACASAFVYGGAAGRLVTVYKDEYERRLAPVIAAAMATAIDEAASWSPRGFDLSGVDAVCFVPATAAAYARRGFDHMEAVARALAAEFGLPVADILVRKKALDQRALGRAARAANVSGTFSVAENPYGTGLLLLDDVVTTGASVKEAAATLKGAGATRVLAASLARTW
jgi:predicted amidophosphoribosyltransferase